MISPVEVVHASGRNAIVLVCEHASAFMPDEFASLGLSDQMAQSHLAWDPGADDMAQALSDQMDAVLVRGTVSRLIYDCNRPPEAPDAIRQSGEGCPIPGNINLSETEKAKRVAQVYRPFQKVLDETITAHPVTPVLVTLHSFTPVLNGEQRDVEIGILHDADARFADALFNVAQRDHGQDLDIRRNEPYGPEDGVTHTLREHALPRGLLNVMIEIRNDLLATPGQCSAMAARLKLWLEAALADVQASQHTMPATRILRA
jgi:predicted N-formylglutamate amidohydrolase